jgi:hypothetical protein
MKRQPPEERKNPPPAAAARERINSPSQSEIPLEIDDLLLLAMAESVIRPKKKKFQSRPSLRRSKLP